MLASVKTIPFKNDKERIRIVRSLYKMRSESEKYMKIEVENDYVYVEEYEDVDNLGCLVQA